MRKYQNLQIAVSRFDDYDDHYCLECDASVKGYTRLEVMRKELEISGIQDVRSKHK
jgi:hypothetical protein